MQEFKDEKIGLKATFDNFLKLPLAGKLDRANGNITNTRSSGRYWTSALVYDPKPEFITVTYHHWYNLWIATHDRIAVQIALRANRALSPIFSSLNSCIVGTEKPTGQIESNLLERTYPLVSALVQS
jgi:hypothetical protein